MQWHRSILIAVVAFWFTTPASAADWLTAPSYYTHDHSSGQRVAQYSPVGPFYYYQRPDFQRSGYRNYRSTIDLGNSADNLHVVETWGAPVIPYEQWRFPYRPYGAPYQDWGPPFGGLGGSSGGYPYSGGNGVNIWGGFFPPFGFGGPGGFGAAGSGTTGPGFSGPGSFGAGSPFGAGLPTPPTGPGFPGWFNPPAVNFAQPWLDGGHYPTYDLNDRSRYWQPYLPPTPPRF